MACTRTGQGARPRVQSVPSTAVVIIASVLHRRTAPVFALFLVMIFAGIVLAIVIGIARTGDDPAVTRTAQRFEDAIKSHD